MKVMSSDWNSRRPAKKIIPDPLLINRQRCPQVTTTRYLYSGCLLWYRQLSATWQVIQLTPPRLVDIKLSQQHIMLQCSIKLKYQDKPRLQTSIYVNNVHEMLPCLFLAPICILTSIAISANSCSAWLPEFYPMPPSMGSKTPLEMIPEPTAPTAPTDVLV